MVNYFDYTRGKLKILREQNGYSLDRLAELASNKSGIRVSRDQVFNLEKSGRVNSFDPEILSAVISVYGETLSSFLRIPDEEKIRDIDSEHLGQLLAIMKNKSSQNVEICIKIFVKMLGELEKTYPSKQLSKKVKK